MLTTGPPSGEIIAEISASSLQIKKQELAVVPPGLSLQAEVHPQPVLRELGQRAGLIRHCQINLLGVLYTRPSLFQLATDNL